MNQIQKYVWLVDIIHRKKHISLKEINRYWINSSLSNGEEIPERTFHKWRIAVEDLFGLIIENERSGEYRYYILNDDEINCGEIQTWLLNTIAVSNIIANNLKLKDRIILENIPSGRKYLSMILDAMRENKVITILYHSYWREDSTVFELEPYCVKLFKQRWYLAAHSISNDKIMIFALDRITNLSVIDEKNFRLPNNFSSEELFFGCYGVIADFKIKSETVTLQVSGNQSKYFRSLPLHKSQREIFVCEEYSIFEYNIRPTFDFQRELLSYTPYVEVISPAWLRNEIAWKVEAMSRRYNG